MKLDLAPALDSRTAVEIFEQLTALAPAWTPELLPAKGDPSYALLQIFARYMQGCIDRLNQAPDKNLLAFLDTFGISLIPPKPARAPVVFMPVPNAADAIVPARTRVSAKVPTQAAPLVFETEQDGSLAAAKLTDLVALWPARDMYADHSSDAAGKRPFRLFEALAPVPHEFYIAHDTVLSFSGTSRIDIEFELTPPGNKPIATKWEFWDGQVWRPFRDIDPADPQSGSDGTLGFTRSGILSLRAGCGESQPTTVYGVKAHWIRGRVAGPLSNEAGRILPQVERVRIRSVIQAGDVAAFPPDAAFADATKLDVSKVFYPFDQQPRTGSTFYFSAKAALGKPSANVVLSVTKVTTEVENNLPAGSQRIEPTLLLEYWNGSEWIDTQLTTPTLYSFVNGGFSLQIQVPPDIAPTTVNNQTNYWMRMRIQFNNFAWRNTITYTNTTPSATNTLNILTVVPPALEKLMITYAYKSPWTFPDRCVTYSDFQWTVRTRDVRWPGRQFPIFSPVSDGTPALYFGFDRPLPNAYVSAYLDLAEAESAGPPLVWEAWNGESWDEIPASDETGRLSRPGMISFVPPAVPPRPTATITGATSAVVTATSPLDAAVFKPGDCVLVSQNPNVELRTVERIDSANVILTAPLEKTYTGGEIAISALPRFGTSRDWVRARLKDDGAPTDSQVNGVYLNAMWVRQVETVTQEILGGGLGIPNQSFFLNKVPVLPGQQIEVRELDGLRANVEYPTLLDELTASGYDPRDLVVNNDPRTNRVTEVWVLWEEKPHFYFSGPEDRHYIVERTGGRVIFGDSVHGKLPPPGSGNIRARTYHAGGGLVGNVPAGAINQIMSGVLASRVSNPRAGEGGADGETPARVLVRGPNVFRHQERSVSAVDFETLAREASPAIAAVRVLPTTAANGRPAAGSITVVVVPQSQDPQPQPSFDLRQEVHDFLASRAPATVAASNIAVIGPTYLPVGVAGFLVPKDLTQAGSIAQAAATAMAAFLHPLTGGPDGEGWPFGRGVYLSDVASILEAIPGVDHAEFLELRLDDTSVGDEVKVPPDRMVVAGPIRLEVRGT